MTEFETMLDKHINSVQENLRKIRMYLVVSNLTHDKDKIDNNYIKDVYEEHFKKLKEIPWGTPEYKAYELEHFSKVHLMHAQQPHHFNDYRSTYDSPNLVDVIELIADIKASYEEYEPEEKRSNDTLVERIMIRLNERDFTMEDYVRYTLAIMKSEHDELMSNRELELQERINSLNL